jgi:glycosyltransferase involved in cell wall biosynthesis
MRLAARIVPVAARPRLERQLAPATEGLAGIRTWTGRLALWGLSFVVMLLAASTNYLLCLAFELRVPATGAIVLLVALQVSNSIVSVPGNLGVFHYVTVLVLSYYGVERNVSVAYAIVLHTVAVLPKVVAGTGFLLFSSARVDLRELAARGEPDVTAPGERRVRMEGHPDPVAPGERSSQWQHPIANVTTRLHGLAGEAGTGATARVSVVIPCCNEAEFIEQLLDAVAAQEMPPHEVIVVDNGSTDDSRLLVGAYAARHPAMPLRLLGCATAGAAAAMNVGIRAAGGDVIVRLDAHSKPHPAYIRRAAGRLNEPRAGVVGGVWEIAPGAPTLRARAIALAVGAKLGSGGAAYRHADTGRTPSDADTVPFGCYTRALWEALNGYDDTLQVVEDGEFNYRARRAGYRVILDPDIRSTYYPRRRLRTLAQQYFRYGWWKIPMLRRHPGAIRIRQLIPLGFVSALAVLLVAGLFFPPALRVLGAVVVVYGAAIFGSAFLIARRTGDWRLWLPVACAFAVVHFAWGGGGLLHLLTLGRWPPWRPRLRTRPA